MIAGALSDTEAGKAVDALLGGLPEGGPVDPPAIQADFTPRRILLLQPDAEASSLTFIGPLPPTAEGHEFDDIILVKALGVGEGSVLFNAVRTDLRAAYGFSAGLGAFSRANRFLVLRGQVETSKMAQVEEAVLKAYTTFRETGPEGPVSNLKAPFAANIQKTAGQPASVSFSGVMPESW
ncbi:insulinase family protein [Profundibacter sp.]|uniref:insulinase family protein n=1 Tax=Profundibacter sp. TaxID=3101071 RepID=UPI003D0B8E0A